MKIEAKQKTIKLAFLEVNKIVTLIKLVECFGKAIYLPNFLFKVLLTFFHGASCGSLGVRYYEYA